MCPDTLLGCTTATSGQGWVDTRTQAAVPGLRDICVCTALTLPGKFCLYHQWHPPKTTTYLLNQCHLQAKPDMHHLRWPIFQLQVGNYYDLVCTLTHRGSRNLAGEHVSGVPVGLCQQPQQRCPHALGLPPSFPRGHRAIHRGPGCRASFKYVRVRLNTDLLLWSVWCLGCLVRSGCFFVVTWVFHRKKFGLHLGCPKKILADSQGKLNINRSKRQRAPWPV